MLGKTLSGRYHIVKHLGCGGFGQTYLAEDRQLPGNPLCVVKQLKPKASDPLTLQVSRRLFDREAQVLYKLGKHDQIPQLLAHFEQEQEFYLVQEFIEGHELKQELPVGKQLSENQVITLCGDILKILEFVHQQDVIHRDIKPSNLMRRKQDGKIVLIDFGAVKQVSAQKTNEGNTTLTVAIGSPGYMANEQLGGKPRFCSDIYAVGMIGIQAITGIQPSQLPEDSTTGEIIWRDKVQVSQQFADVLDKMVRYDYRHRYQTATEALQAFELVNSQIATQTYNNISTHKPSLPVDAIQAIVTSTLPPQISPSEGQINLDTAANLSRSQVDSPKSNVGVATSKNQSRRLMKIGAGITTALALTAGISFFYKNNNLLPLLQPANSSWNRVENISLVYTLSEQGSVEALAISADGQFLASRSSNDNTIKLWNLGDGKLLYTLADAKGNPDNGLAFSSDGKILASATRDNTVKLWNPHTGKALPPLTGHSDWVNSIAFSSDGQTLASGSRDKTIKFWNLSTGKLLRTLTDPANEAVEFVAFSPNSQTIASSNYHSIKLWNLQGGHLEKTIFDSKNRGGEIVAYSPDGQKIISSIGNTISLWELGNLPNSCEDIQPCQPTRTFTHSDRIVSFAISRDGQTLASASWDKTIKLWNLQSGQLKSTIPNRSASVDAVTFSPDGKVLVSAGGGKIKVWRSP
ncbi:protein kinase [Coleofasciculus sp. H7-2]|uniref:protein kinase domain-containing protein n=1 Tax=Coleofasciculus sp. H7-2 TaxID=3351545 RepID=UPI003673582E